MTTEQATHRFLKTFLPAIFVYVIANNGIRWASDSATVSASALYASSLIPILAILFAFWTQWRFANEVDEFLRLIQIKGILFGIACVMVIASGWGTLEMLAEAPTMPVFWLLPIFWVAQSAAIVIISKREGAF